MSKIVDTTEKQFFNDLLYIYERTTDKQKTKLIIKFVSYYYYTNIRNKELNNKQLKDYLNTYNNLIKFLKQKQKKHLEFIEHINTDNIIIHFLKNGGLKIYEITRKNKDIKIQEKLNKFIKIDNKQIKNYEKVKEISNKLLKIINE